MKYEEIVESQGVAKYENDTKPHKVWFITGFDIIPTFKEIFDNLDCTRIAWGKETCPRTNKPHHHLFISFKRGYRGKQLSKLTSAWFGSGSRNLFAKVPDHAWNYCIKDGQFHVRDNRRQGERTDVHEYRDMIKRGATDRELALAKPECFLKFSRTDAMRRALTGGINERRTEYTKLVIIHGSPGQKYSKSDKVDRAYPNAAWMDFDGRYWSNYNNEEIVVLDDIDIDKLPRKHWLGLINRKPWMIRVLGSYMHFNSKMVVIITNKHPDKIYSNDGAIRKRIKNATVIKFSDDEKWVKLSLPLPTSVTVTQPVTKR